MINSHTDDFSFFRGENIPLIPGHYQRLEQVIVNLIQNSCQTLELKKKIIRIQTCSDETEKFAMITIVDTGVNIAKQNMDHITDPFFTTKRNQGGTGLGLSISSAIIAEHHPHIPVIIVTGLNEVQTAVECMTCGTFDYMVKPVEPSRLISGVKRAVDMQEERLEYKQFRRKVLEDDLASPQVFSKIVTGSKAMRSIFQYCETIVSTGKPLLITGESGMGKELIANAVHTLFNLKGDFISVNVAGLDDQLFSDTLFGHLKGAFTIYISVMEDAPWVPIFNELRFTMRAERLGGPDAIFVDPVHIPVNYEHVYAKDVQ